MDWHKSIEETGLTILSGVLRHEYLDRLQEELNQLAPRRSRAGIRHALRLAPVAGLARHPILADLASGVLGAAAIPFRATLFDNSPDANWSVVWHQDTALPLRERMDLPGWGPWSVKEGIPYAHAPEAALSQVLALRIHLDDSAVGNGPLRVLPGTHKLGVLTDDRIHELATSVAPWDCVVPKGGIVAMRPLAVHASSKSQTEMPRRVVHIEYAASASIAEPLELAVG